MDNFVGEIRLFAGIRNQPPLNWAFCNGQILSISQYQALFSLIGAVYGGDGRTTFALPNLPGRVVIGQGQGTGLSNYVLAGIGGSDEVSLNAAQVPAHTHSVSATTTTATTNVPSALVGLAAPAPEGTLAYQQDNTSATQVQFDESMVAMAGGSAPHLNVMPSFCLCYIIALQGNYPTRPS